MRRKYKTKIDRIRSQELRESCSAQPNNEWVKRRREWDNHIRRMDAERLVKISRGNYLQEEYLQDVRKKLEPP